MKRLLLVLPVLLAAACASDDGASSGGSGRSGWTSGSRVDAPAEAPTIRTFPTETRAFMEEGLRQFSRRDPRWESTRREWLALGPRESEFLVQLMWGALLAGQRNNAPEIVEGARHELALIGEPSIGMAAGVLRAGKVGSVYDAATGEQKPVNLDDLQRREAAEVLSIIGAPAVPAVTAALDGAETKSGKRFALQSLGNMGDRGGDRAARTLAAYSRDSDEVLRVDAVHGMRTYHDDVTRSALLAALDDSDDLVREKAADSLASRGDRSVIGALRSAGARARSESKLAEARRMDRAAEILEKHGR